MQNDSRYIKDWHILSRLIRSIYNYHCANCFKDCSNPKFYKDKLQVHHIDENPRNNKFDNLIPLCSSCHLKIEKEARVHAPYSHLQQELFKDSTYKLRMEEMRSQALNRFGINEKEEYFKFKKIFEEEIKNDFEDHEI